MLDLTTAMMVLGVVSAIYLFYRAIAGRRKVYRNALKLSGIPHIEELKAHTAWSIGAKNHEFIHIAETMEDWQLARISIADYVQDEDHKKALLKDLAFLKIQADKALREEGQQPPSRQSVDFLRLRDVFVKNADIEISRLQGWKPILKEERPIPFREFNVKVVCFFSGDGARKIVIGGEARFFEEGDFIIKQEMLDTNESAELARVKVVKTDMGKVINLAINSSGSSRLVFYEQSTGREEKRVL